MFAGRPNGLAEGVDLLVFNLSEFIWAAINFVIFLAVMRLMFFKPVIKLLDDRKRGIEEQIRGAEAARGEAERLRQEYESRLNEAQLEARRILQNAAQQAERSKEEIIAKANDEAAQLIERAERAIEVAKQKAFDDLQAQVAELAVLAAEKVIRKMVTPEDHRRLTREFIEEVGEIQ